MSVAFVISTVRPGHHPLRTEPYMSLFTGTTEFYRRYRPGIPEEVAQVLDRATPVGRPRRLLDVGTGTGLVVEALLSRFDDVIGVDNDADMLAAAEAVR